MKIRRTGIAATLLAVGAFAPAMASNYTVGGPNQSYYFLPNWGSNGQTVSVMPTLENMTTALAGSPGSKPAHMVPDPKGQFMFSINHGGNALSVFDAKSGEFIKQIVTGSAKSKKGQGHQYYWSPDGNYLYVTELDDDAVVEVDARNLVVSRRAENVADFPFGMVPAWDQGYLYVVGEGPGPVEVERPGHSVTQFDLKTFKPIKKIRVGQAPHAMAYTNGKVYVGNIAKGQRSVSVIDAAKGEVVKTIDVDYENPHFLEEPANGNHLADRGLQGGAGTGTDRRSHRQGGGPLQGQGSGHPQEQNPPPFVAPQWRESVLSYRFQGRAHPHLSDLRSRSQGTKHLRTHPDHHAYAAVEQAAKPRLCCYGGQ